MFFLNPLKIFIIFFFNPLILITNKGDGQAIVYVNNNVTFDREQQKEYQIPIVIRDNGNPSLSATNILTVTIGDINDNKMQPGSKTIFVNCLKGAYDDYAGLYIFCS